MRLPKLIVVGYGKCGTTSLFRYLSDHPAVATCTRKETNMFLSDDDASIIEGCDLYYSGKGLRIDVSPGYIHSLLEVLVRVDSVYKLIGDDLPTLVVCTRSPLAKIVSVYKAGRRSDVIPSNLDFRQFVINALKGVQVSKRLDWDEWLKNDVTNSKYYAEVELLEKYFPNNRLVYIDQSVILDQPIEVMEELCKILLIDPTFYFSYRFSIANKGMEPRFFILDRCLLWLNHKMEYWFSFSPNVKRILVVAYRKFFSKTSEWEGYHSEELSDYIHAYSYKTQLALNRVNWIVRKPLWVDRL
jgi:hypothetical protein